MRRRSFLITAGLALTAADAASGAPASNPATHLSRTLGDTLLGATRGTVGTLADLRAALALARREFADCSYGALATRLPDLVSTAEVTATEHPSPTAFRVLAEVHQLVTRVLVKSDHSGLEWVSADRSVRAARRTDNGLVLAESQRLVASVVRRAGDYDRARSLTLGATDHLALTGKAADPAHLMMAVTLYCSAGHAAAKAGDQDWAGDLLAEADATASRLRAQPDQHRAVTANVISHQVSAAYLLGDPATALTHAHRIPLSAIPTTERRARLLVDTAMAYHQHGDTGRAYSTLLSAERIAPGEVRTRHAAHRLIRTLLDHRSDAGMTGLRAFAVRSGVRT